MANEILNKGDILFLYENIKANPNGDPDENKPRIDPITRHCFVTDVRIKRTVRDYLNKYKEEPIFVERREAGEAITASFRLHEEVEKLKKEKKPVKKDELIKKLFSAHIDVRLFGCTITIQEKEKKTIKDFIGEEIDSITRPGPVQVILGESLHKVEMETIKGTTAFASKEKPGQGTFGTFSTKYILPYALIAVSGVINPTSGKKTGLTQNDIDLFLEGLWFGTLNLNTGSKNQIPKILVKVDYNSEKFNIGMLDRYLMGNLKLNEINKEENIRCCKQFYLVLDDLVGILENRKTQISKITIIDDGEIISKYNDKEKRLADALKEAEIDKNKIIELTPEQLIINKKENS